MSAFDIAAADAAIADALDTVETAQTREHMDASTKFHIPLVFYEGADAATKRANFNTGNIILHHPMTKAEVGLIIAANSSCFDANGGAAEAPGDLKYTYAGYRAAALFHIMNTFSIPSNDNDAITLGFNGAGNKPGDGNPPAVGATLTVGSVVEAATNKIKLDLRTFLDYADCRAVEVTVQSATEPQATRVRDPVLQGSNVILPPNGAASVANAVGEFGTALAVSRSLLNLSMLSLFKTGHHWTSDTVPVLQRLSGALCLPPEIGGTLHGARTVTHVFQRSVRHNFMCFTSTGGKLEASAKTRCTGTGHGLAKIALIKAIITSARAGGTRENEIYILELFHLAGILTDLEAMLLGLVTGTIKTPGGVVLTKPLGCVDTVCFSNCLMPEIGLANHATTKVAANNGNATAWFVEMRRRQECIDKVKGAMLNLVAALGGTFEQSLTFGKPKTVTPAQRLEVVNRLKEIQTAMQANADITKKFTAAQIGNFTNLADVHKVFSNKDIR